MAPRAPASGVKGPAASRVRFQPRQSVTVNGKGAVIQTSVGDGEWIVITDDGRRLVVNEKQMHLTGDKSGVVIPKRVLK